MRLSRVRIEGYRALRRLDLALDELTAIIGENGYGKTSLLDALMTCLGAEAGAPVFAVEDFHVPPPPEPQLERVTIELSFVETRPVDRAARAPLAPAFVGPAGEGRLVLRVEAQRSGSASAIGVITFCDPDGRALAPQPPEATLAALREACPAIVLRAGRYFVGPSRAPGEAAPKTLTADVALEQQVLQAYTGLAAGWEATADLRAGIDAARAIVDRYAEQVAQRPRPRTATTRLLESLAQAPGARSAAPEELLRAPGGAAQGLAALLIVGGLFQARGDAASLVEADPILVIEDPEANLHPLVTANVSRLIDALPIQRIVTTNSHDVLASIPLWALRRAVRRTDGVHVHRVERRELSLDELRRVGYHVRSNRADALFARAWLLVEGETEFWLVPELARVLGIDLPAEGVRVVEFAQCGIEPLVKLAQALDIAWNLLADGDDAGQRYADRARDLAGPAHADELVTLLEDQDIEHCFWAHGFHDVFRAAAGMKPAGTPKVLRRRTSSDPAATKVITRAIAIRSKPRLALEVLEAVAERGPDAVPPNLRALIETTVRLARA